MAQQPNIILIWETWKININDSLPGPRFSRGQNNYSASLIPLPFPRHFLTIISHGIRATPQNIVLRWIVRCGRDNYGRI